METSASIYMYKWKYISSARGAQRPTPVQPSTKLATCRKTVRAQLTKTHGRANMPDRSPRLAVGHGTAVAD